ncbi:hypothetical protein [Nostoc sp. MG11]|uniref:hypothetical protein n=1 Tax=Nostoc sp. MG11 TaxID=2721166 RepID=UPI0018691033|nr:hypothetical protein [Nostoc sp. MG11]
MANIKIHNLRPAGSELFNDSESFLNELTEGEITTVEGGLVSLTLTYSVTVTRTYSYSWTRTRTFPSRLP